MRQPVAIYLLFFAFFFAQKPNLLLTNKKISTLLALNFALVVPII